MKDQPLPLNSAVDLCQWVQFSLVFLNSFDRLSGLRCFALPSFYEEKIGFQKSGLNQVKSVK